VRARITVARDAGEDAIKQRALAEPQVKLHLDGKQIAKLVVVPGRLVSLVVR
jgi:leucyl-tRNA synthetase